MTIKTLETRQVSRRELFSLFGAGTLAAMGIGIAGPAFADAKGVDAAIAKITGGKAAGSGKITMDVPQIAENGSTVPITVSVDSPMTDASHVKTLHVWADGNPSPEVASFHFTPMSGKAYVSTRIRLAKTQNVVTLAEMSDGSFAMGKAEVKVTIGGCGG
jgi:sulfur-oxidizing protein SoxY